MSVAESVQYPWERTLTDPNKVPYYVKYACVLCLRKMTTFADAFDYSIAMESLYLCIANMNVF